MKDADKQTNNSWDWTLRTKFTAIIVGNFQETTHLKK